MDLYSLFNMRKPAFFLSLTLVVTLTQNSMAQRVRGQQADAIAAAEPADLMKKIEVKTGYGSFTEGRNDFSTHNGLFRKCEKLIGSKKKWNQVVTSNTSYSTKEVWQDAWDNFGYEQANKLEELEGEKIKKLSKFYEEFNNDINLLRLDIAHCEAMRSLTSGTDYRDSESLKSGKSATKSSLDGAIECQSAGTETQDYKACVSEMEEYNFALVGTTVAAQVQGVKYQSDSTKAINSYDSKDPTAGLKAQKSDIENRANLTNQRAGLDVVKAAGLWMKLESIPDHEDLNDRCVDDVSRGNISYEPIHTAYENLIKNFYDIELVIDGQGTPSKTIGVILSTSTGSTSDTNDMITQRKDQAEEASNPNIKASKFCEAPMRKGSKLVLNQKAKQSLKSAAIAAGVDGAKHTLTAKQLKKQAAQVGKVIDEVDNFNPEDVPEFQGQDFQGSECALDPSADGCDDFVQERSYGFQNQDPLQIHGMEKASSFKRGNGVDGNPRGDDEAGPSASRGDAPKPIGIIDPKVAKKSGFDGRMPGAADVSSDGPGAPSGGGGGGPGGGGGSPPPAANAPAPQGEDGPQMGGAGNSNAAYSGGGGDIRTRGGGGAQGSRREESGDENPFSKLFGEDGPGSENLNFRGAASEEGQINAPETSIFEIISERYTHVAKEDRLLEYEMTDAKDLK